MKNLDLTFLIDIKDKYFNNVFKSSDSKYFIYTAFKITLIPFLSFCIVGFSLWTIMELNFNFFVANGFESGEGFKQDFYNTIFLNISDYLLYTCAILVLVFGVGLIVSYLALRAFDHLKNFTDSMSIDYDQELEVQGLNKNKLIYQVSRIFFKYIQLTIKNGKRPTFKLPEKIEQLNQPQVDKVFLIQYALVVGIICLVTNFILFTFTKDLYESIVRNGTSLIDTNSVVTSFLNSQESLLSKIYSFAIIFNVLGYVLISKSIIKAVDGVCYGFARDMVNVIKGEHQTRLRPRYNDPGKAFALNINDYLEEIFPYSSINESDEEKDDSHLAEETEHREVPHYQFQKLEELNNSEDFDDELESVDDNVLQLSSIQEVVEDDEDELPPMLTEEIILKTSSKSK